MRIDFSKIPNKLFDICDFRKNENGGTTLYSYPMNNVEREVIIVASLEELEIPHAFKVNSKAIEASKKLNGSNLEIIINDNTFQAKSEKGRYKVALLNTEAFVSKDNEWLAQINVSISYLLKACEYVAIKTNKPALRGVHIDSNGNIVATDSFKVYVHKAADFTEEGITIPVNFIRIIKEIFGDEENINLEFSQTKVKASKDNITIIGNLYEGKFPNIDKILYVACGENLNEVKKDELIDSLDYLKYIVNESKDRINYLVFKNGLLTIKGQSTFETSCNLGLESDTKICMQANNLLEGLKTFEDAIIQCSCNVGFEKNMFTLKNNNGEYVVLLCVKME